MARSLLFTRGLLVIVTVIVTKRRRQSRSSKTTTSSIDEDCGHLRRKETVMVRKYTKAGNPYNEPPYTEEELDDFDQRMSNVSSITIVYSGPAGDRYRTAPTPPPKTKQEDDDLLD
jgi:hypothetical protein